LFFLTIALCKMPVVLFLHHQTPHCTNHTLQVSQGHLVPTTMKPWQPQPHGQLPSHNLMPK
jgi:hypothetical protein